MRKISIFVFMIVMSGYVTGYTQTLNNSSNQPKRNLYVVGTSHLDTQWRWTIQNTINEYVPATFRDNFKLMQQFPDYVFSFEGAFKYMLLKEYYPEEYQRLKPYVTNGHWRLAGSWVDAVDVNMPSFESLVRQSLYGNGYFKQEFGKTSRDVLLPDCFGFGYALPSIAAHCGLKSFSTQKLSWGSSVGVPFDIGIWEGVDGSTLVSALRPGDYVAEIKSDLSRDTTWLRKIDHQGDTSRLYAGYMYFGTGDTGGSPDSASVDWLERSIKSDGPITVHSVGSDDLVDIVNAQKDVHLPRYQGELLMTRHGAGCYTSEAAMKRWNRKNELLADAAERASVIAHTLGGLTYPREALKETWIRFLWHQFHDDLTGTSIPEAYEFSWNDEILCQNRFAGLLENAVEATTPALDTRAKGVPLVVFNPLAIPREDVVEALVGFSGKLPEAIRVFGPDGKEVPSQISQNFKDSLKVLFLARVPSVGYAVFDVRPDKTPCIIKTGLAASVTMLENQRYLVKLNSEGDVVSILDKLEKRELLTAPIKFQILHDKPKQWPAWEVQYEDIMAEPQASVGGKAEIKVLENGPAQVAVEVIRHLNQSMFRTVIHLTAGSDRIEFDNDIDWYERETMLKAAFPLATANDSVTYDLGLGTIKRGINTPKKYEVPGQQWADMTSPVGDYGVAILNDCKYGWDHPDKGTLRLSLIHTPGVFDNWMWVGDQESQDNGHHKMLFAVHGHRGDWREGGVVWQSARLNQPLLTFQVPIHKGGLGKKYSLLSVSSGKLDVKSEPESLELQVMVNAVKLAENSDEIVLRLREIQGKPVEQVQIRFANPILSAREVNGAEEPLGNAQVANNSLITSLHAYQPKAFALRIAPQPGKLIGLPSCSTWQLSFDTDGISGDENRRDGNLDGEHNTLSGDLLPDTLHWQNIPFVFGPKTPSALNVVSCTGQTLKLAALPSNRIYLIATAAGGPAQGTFTIDDIKTTVWLQDYAERLGQWNNRLVSGEFLEEPNQIAPGYINREPVAWVGTHRHNSRGEDEAYQFTYLYLIRLDVPKKATTLTLPDNPRIKLLAATQVNTNYDKIRLARPLYDVTNATVTNIVTERTAFVDQVVARITCPIPGTEIHYTIDGSEPTSNSPRYEQPITVLETTTLKSRAFLSGVDDHYVSSLSFRRLILKEPMKVVRFVGGLDCHYYEGEWSKLPNFDSLAAKQEMVMDTVGIPSVARQELYGLVFTGYVQVPQDGLYEFSISSDDGSDLTVADSLLVDNDGLHGAGEVTGAIALKAGLHPIKLRMFQAKGDQALEVSIQGPGLEKQSIPSKMLFHAVKPKAR